MLTPTCVTRAAVRGNAMFGENEIPNTNLFVIAAGESADAERERGGKTVS